MKPVDKGPSPKDFKRYSDAKPYLVDRLGPFCSYCERRKDPQDLHVEHIYPKDPHPKRETRWRNFLLACNSCNSYKARYLGNGRQQRLIKSCLWPHVDNTTDAFHYEKNGLMTVHTGLAAPVAVLATHTIDMIGALKSPAVASSYEALGIAYDGVDKREEAWGTAEIARADYLANRNSTATLDAIVRMCETTGHFSIWMRVFARYPEVKSRIIACCKAAAGCFDAAAKPIQRGRC